MPSLLDVRHLTVVFDTPRGRIRAVDDVSLSVGEEEALGIVGESGCGKSTLALALMGLVPEPGYVAHGEIRFGQLDLVGAPESRWQSIRAERVAMVFQASMNSFNPVLRIRTQVEHVLEAHPTVFSTVAEGLSAMRELLKMVNLDPGPVLQAYPHELSGGMKQRVAIALALLLSPRLLILDEPTTALDVLNQRGVLDSVKRLRRELRFGVILITHDLGIVAELAERVAVMYAGQLVEVGPCDDIFYAKRRHPYVAGLLRAAPAVFSDQRAEPIAGSVPDLAAPPPGCRFADRCPLVDPACRADPPALLEEAPGHLVRCPVTLGGKEMPVWTTAHS
jgi:peptide/nickel transport system ATP-binding protein